MANKKKISVTANGHDVYSIVNDQHMLAHPVSEDDLSNAIWQIELKPPFGFYTVDFEEPVGFDNCVETSDSDDIRMECREGREKPSRMVYGRKPEPTSLVTIGICTDDDGKETIFTAFYGQRAPKELSDPRLTDEEKAEAESFWANHALVAQEEPGPMDLDVEEADCFCEVGLTINGINACMSDFGKKSLKAGCSSLGDDDPRCTCVWESSRPSRAICAKYHITEAQFNEVADLIESELSSFEECCWCY